MPRRFISLYYGSIGRMRALGAVAGWAAGAFVPPARRREALARAVRSRVGGAGVFAVGSARSALALCLKGAGLDAGDEVLLSSYTCLAVPTGVIAAGARPHYADIDAQTLNVEAEAIGAALTPRVRAIVVQHTLGKVAPVEAVLAQARGRGIWVIEDCALAIGSSIGGRVVGTSGHAAIFSMELSKTVSCGWGGILVVHDEALAAKVAKVYDVLPEPGWRSSTRDIWQTAISAWCHQPALYEGFGKYALHAGFASGLFRRSTPEAEYGGAIAPGFLMKLGGAQAALAERQWRDLDEISGACEAHARELRAVLGELGASMPAAPGRDERSVAPRVSFLVHDRPQAAAYFRARGIELGEWFDGPMSPPPTAPVFNYRQGAFEHAERVAGSVVNLPCHSRLTGGDVAHVAATLRAFARDHPGGIVRPDSTPQSRDRPATTA